jgi:ribosome-associated toxin RatA of RatAB toxin-antitoxin module
VDTRIGRVVRAAPRTIYALAAAVEDWPRLLPHYRWVRVLATDGALRRTVEMAARRDVVGRIGVPLRWTAVQTLHPDITRIEFVHVRGISRGMHVVWTIDRDPGDPSQALVEISHRFAPAWPVPDALISAVVGEYFVNGVAQRTLAHLGALAQQRPS